MVLDNVEKPIALVRTRLGMEALTASYIEEALPGCKAVPLPKGFKGLVLVHYDADPDTAVEKLEKIPEVEKAFPIYAFVKAGLEVARKALIPSESFAVRCVRRGKHDFTSLEANSLVGAKIVEELGCKVDLTRPDKVVAIGVLGEYAAIGVADGSEFPTKKGKKETYPSFSKVHLAQLPYLGEEEAKFMGEKIGRVIQSFEISKYFVALGGSTPLYRLKSFLEGLGKGVESRYGMQRKVYTRPVRRVRTEVVSIYELVRGWGGPIIVFEPEGRPYPEVSKKIAEVVNKGDALSLMGSREGVPSGLFRFAELMVDLALGISLATEVAISSALPAIAFPVSEI